MLRLLADIEGPLNLRGARAVALPPAPVVELAEPTAVRRPSRAWRARQWWKNLRDGSLLIPTLARLARRCGLMVAYSELRGIVYHRDGSITDYGLLGRRVVTDAGVAYLAADIGGGASDSNLFKYHGYGTGTTAEAANQTALTTELTTEYATNSTRPTGSQANATNTYTTVGTLAPDSGGVLAITEHGIFSATSAGTLWDRTKFSAVNLDSTAGDSLATTYVLTLPAGG